MIPKEKLNVYPLSTKQRCPEYGRSFRRIVTSDTAYWTCSGRLSGATDCDNRRVRENMKRRLVLQANRLFYHERQRRRFFQNQRRFYAPIFQKSRQEQTEAAESESKSTSRFLPWRRISIFACFCPMGAYRVFFKPGSAVGVPPCPFPHSLHTAGKKSDNTGRKGQRGFRCAGRRRRK